MHSVLRKYLSVCVGDDDDGKRFKSTAIDRHTPAQRHNFPSHPQQMMNTILPSSELPTKEQ